MIWEQLEFYSCKVDGRIQQFIDIVGVSRKFDFTLIGVHGNSGNAAATALAPASLVYLPTPTKNSRPTNMKKVTVLSISTIK